MKADAVTSGVSWRRVIVEGVVIVGSILLAFSIDAAWDARQEARHRSDLIEALHRDFETTQERLAASIARADSLVARSNAFLTAVGSGVDIPLDSLGYLAAGAFRAIVFEPALSSYEGAVATGDLGLIQTQGLLGALAEFNRQREYFADHARVAAELFYLGASWELRRTVGSQRLLEADTAGATPIFQMSESAYRRLTSSPQVYAGIETVTIANQNIIRALEGMSQAASRVIAELEAIR